MKGQYLTVEWVIFFGIGVTLIIATYLAFSGISTTVRDSALTSQLERSGELVRGSVANVFLAASETGSQITYDLSIPSKASGCAYQILVDSAKMLNVNCTDNLKQGVVLSLYGINTNSLNTIYSTRGYIKISSNGNTVDLS